MKHTGILTRLIWLLFLLPLALSSLASQDRQQLIKQAQAYEAKSEHQLALALYFKINDLQPKDSWIAWRIGSTLFTHLGRIADGAKWFIESINRSPENIDLYFHVFAAADALEDMDLAQEVLQRLKANALPAAQLNPERRKGLLESLGRYIAILKDRERYQEAYALIQWGLSYDKGLESWWFTNASLYVYQGLGHIAFGQGKASQARAFYQMGLDLSKSKSGLGRELPKLDLSEMITATRDWEARKKPNKVFVHKIVSLYLAKTEVDQVYKDGVRRSSSRSITPLQRMRSAIIEPVLTRLVEAWSGGQMTLSWNKMDLDATVTAIHEDTFNSDPTWTPDLSRIVTNDGTDLGELLYDLVSSYDTVLWYWEGQSVSNIASGGMLNLPLVPWQLDSVGRGYINFPISWPMANFLSALMHEFFHVVEAMATISPTHGFQKQVRSSFLAWTGEGQFDYFRWHFKNTLASRFQSLGFLAQKPSTIDLERVKKHRDLAASIETDKRIEADAIARQVSAKYWNSSGAEKLRLGVLALTALELNPHHALALRVAYEYYQSQKSTDLALATLLKLIELAPEPWIYESAVYIAQWQLKKALLAEGLINEFLQRYPQDPKRGALWLSLGRLLVGQERSAEALSAFVSSSEQSPTNSAIFAEAIFWQGYTYGEKLNNKREGLRLVIQGIRSGYDNEFSRHFEKSWR